MSIPCTIHGHVDIRRCMYVYINKYIYIYMYKSHLHTHTHTERQTLTHAQVLCHVAFEFSYSLIFKTSHFKVTSDQKILHVCLVPATLFVCLHEVFHMRQMPCMLHRNKSIDPIAMCFSKLTLLAEITYAEPVLSCQAVNHNFGNINIH